MKVSSLIRNKVEKRAKRRCEYCQSPLEFSSTPFSVEHIFPISKGETDSAENLALACQGCNNHKSVKTDDFDTISQTLEPAPVSCDDCECSPYFVFVEEASGCLPWNLGFSEVHVVAVDI